MLKDLLHSSLSIHPWFCHVSVLASGLQAILPEYLKAKFVQAALSYIACNEEGQFVCRDNDCWCRCAVDYPRCNCPEVHLKAMEASLLQIQDSWYMANQEFEESGQCYPSCTHSTTVTPLTGYKLQPIVRGANWQRQRGTDEKKRQLDLAR